MALRFVLAISCLLAPLAGSRDAAANGRPPGTSTINFRRGMENEIAAGMTFGLVISRDGGATWGWMCEDAIGYTGTFDPDYVFTSSGALFATTFSGLKVMRDGCTFEVPNGNKFVSTISQTKDGTMYYGAADTMTAQNPGDSRIYRSTDDGMTWTPISMPGLTNDWWQSLEAAPSNPMRMYLAGYRFIPSPGGNTKTFLFFRSDNGGQTWQALPPTPQIATMPNSTIEIAGISHSNPDLVFARVTLEDNMISEALYRSVDGGANWTRILGRNGPIAFVVRRSGELVSGTLAQGAARSADSGSTWIDIPDAPHINCLTENTAGEVWACTQNYGGMQAPSDGYGIMKSTNLTTWQGVLKFQEMRTPLACAAGTVQRDTCDQQLWCGLCSQLGCSTEDRADCPKPVEVPPPKEGGCCKTSAAPAPGALLLLIGVFVLLLRPRRRAS